MRLHHGLFIPFSFVATFMKKSLALICIALALSACGGDHHDGYYEEDIYYSPTTIYHEATGVDVPNDACAEDKLAWLDVFGAPDSITTWQNYDTTEEEYSMCDVSDVIFTYTEGTGYCVIEEIEPPYCY